MKKAIGVLLLAVLALSIGAIVGMSDVEAGKAECNVTCEYYPLLENCYPYVCCPGKGGITCTWSTGRPCLCPY